MTTGWPGSVPDPFTVESIDSGAWWCRLVLSGEFDLEGSRLFRQAVSDAVGRGRRHLAVDAAGVTFVDSSALAALLHARTDVLDVGGTFRLTAVSGPVARLLEIAALTDELLDKRQGT